MSWGRSEMNLVEVVDDAMNWIKDGPIGVVLATAVLIH